MYVKSVIPQSPLVTVIIPVYNTAFYLRKCLDSVCGQTYRNLEIICVNDGSTDGSQAILEEYAARDERVKVLVQENAGQAVARNRALDVAQGEWISCIDSDDWIDADTYEKVLEAAFPGVNVICFDARVEGGDDSRRNQAVAEYYTTKFGGLHEISDEHLLNTDTSVATKLIRRKVILEYSLSFPEGKKYEDAAFFYCLMMVAGQIVYMKGYAFYHYFQRPGSTMQRTFAKDPIAINNLEVCAHVRAFCEKHGMVDKWGRVFAEIFQRSYYFTKQFIPEDMQQVLQEHAYQMARKWGLLQRRNLTSVQEIRQMARSRVGKVFHTSYPNRDSYGIGKFSVLSVVHAPGVDTYYLCGCKLFARKLDI